MIINEVSESRDGEHSLKALVWLNNNECELRNICTALQEAGDRRRRLLSVRGLVRVAAVPLQMGSSRSSRQLECNPTSLPLLL